ncbi:MAG: 2OG-Fe(II) oxygenase [Alteromonadaceae bacterium]|nr:2OG-Fe(II) oxygenase [Alteromonadaceae bacterium]
MFLLQDTYKGLMVWPDRPKVYLFENFITAKEADDVIQVAKSKLEVARVTDGQIKGVNRNTRNNMLCWLEHDTTPTILKICRSIAGEVGLPLSNAEPLQVNNYKTGQYFEPHYDALPTPEQSGASGPRLVTALVYLNTVKKGGATFFPALGYKHPPKVGDMLLFHNTLPETLERDLNSLHGADRVLDGEKWAMNLWFRQKRYVK